MGFKVAARRVVGDGGYQVRNIVGAPPAPPASTLAHDAETQSAAFATVATENTTHTPVGTPKGAVVVIVQTAATTDEISGVTYGGQAMNRERKEDRHGASTETGCVYLYFLGSSIPTGAQTVAITSTGTSAKRAVISTVVATGNTVVDVAAGANSNAQANPSLAVTFSGTLARAEVYYGLGNGASAVFSTVESGGTHQFGHDFGSDVAAWARKEVLAAASTTIGYTTGLDDVVHAALAIKDA